MADLNKQYESTKYQEESSMQWDKFSSINPDSNKGSKDPSEDRSSLDLSGFSKRSSLKHSFYTNSQSLCSMSNVLS